MGQVAERSQHRLLRGTVGLITRHLGEQMEHYPTRAGVQWPAGYERGRVLYGGGHTGYARASLWLDGIEDGPGVGVRQRGGYPAQALALAEQAKRGSD